jgi:ABC-2 type transport system ATP-binding protein
MVGELVDESMAVVWATAYLDEAEKCDDILLLSDGKLLYSGPPADLTDTMTGRVYLARLPQAKRREAIAPLLGDASVADAILHGDAIRLLTHKSVDLAHIQSLVDGELVPAAPRFEDAFVDRLGGGPDGRSPLADAMKAHTDTGEAVVEARGLTKRYGNFAAASNITFTQKRGEILGLLGPNGAGKSTTFKMLCGLTAPS